MVNDTTELSLSSLELPKLEACVELMLFTAYADGRVDAAERIVFEEHVRTATHGQLGPDLIRAVLDYIEGSVQVANRTERLAAIAERLAEPRIRVAALDLAAAVAMADGEITSEERTFLAQAARAFDLPSSEVDRALGEARA